MKVNRSDLYAIYKAIGIPQAVNWNANDMRAHVRTKLLPLLRKPIGGNEKLDAFRQELLKALKVRESVFIVNDKGGT